MFDPALLDSALLRRRALIARLESEGTDCWRIFHGSAEGSEGLTIDRYGSLVLVQTFRAPLESVELEMLERELRERLAFPFDFAWNHRAKAAGEGFERWHTPTSAALAERVCREAGTSFLVRARHRGLDPWLFLDLRAGRRVLRSSCRDKSVLNLFAYTSSAGVAAGASGASEVWNVDFASSSVAVGRRNAALNAIEPGRIWFFEEDVLPILRQLAGLAVKGHASSRPYLRVEPRCFDRVFLDPPAWAKGPFGAVDVARDYPSLLKPALACLAPGGQLIATNHVASVSRAEFAALVQRTAEKSCRELAALEILGPDDDFPARDGEAALKIAVARLHDA